MADVFLALVSGPSGSGFAKLAVVKRLRANLVDDPEFVAMLVDEARITARLNHPNVVHTLEVGVENDEYFLAMEYLDGQPLHRLQRRAARTGTEIPRELEYLVVADALAGLHHAHDLSDYDGTPLQIVHRDVTPQNVFVTYDGQVKVVDFGIAKAAGRAAETRHGIVKGKVRYMSPEQAMGQQVDRRSDVFAAGILLWEAATKKRFWSDLDDLAIVQALIAGDFNPSPRDADPSIPEELDLIVRRALERNPDARFATAAEFRFALEAFLGDDIVQARRQLGPLVGEMFAKERRELRNIIEKIGRISVRPPTLSGVSAAASAASSSSTSVMARAAAHTIPVIPPPPRDPVFTPSTSPLTVSGTHPTTAEEPIEYSMLGFIPRKKRFGAGALVGAAMMLVSFVLAVVAVQTLGVVPGVAASASARVPNEVTWRPTSLFLRSDDVTKAHRAEAPPPAPVVYVAPAPRAPARSSAPVTASASTPPSTGTPMIPRLLESARPGNNAHRNVDTADPWSH